MIDHAAPLPCDGPRVAIIGAGFTGSLLAVHLLALAKDASILLFDGTGQFGRGLAYATANADHLLNVRTSNMSALPDKPGHFIDWLVAAAPAGQPIDARHVAHEFVSRGRYGDYVASLLDEAAVGGGQRPRLYRYPDDVVGLTEQGSGAVLKTAAGRTLSVDFAMLCIGNFAPAMPRADGQAVADHPRYLGDPWNFERLALIEPDAEVLVLGTGLTMVDLVLTLAARGHRGSILALSRRGLLPHVHAPTTPYPDFLGISPAPATATGLLRRIRAEIDHAALDGTAWRSVFDAVRPHVQRLWQTLPEGERARFLRHLRPFWDIHRHRMAPAVAERIADLRQQGGLEIAAGRLRELDAEAGGIAALVDLKGGGQRKIAADWLINCSGPQSDFACIREPLIRNLLKTGTARPDALRLGLDVGANLALVRRDGTASRRLFALGPPTRGVFWEITAVPDIRNQCRTFASWLAPKLPAVEPAIPG
jgi:uncharacterized NAD(P)/FAD-binding protein YdhS